MNTSLTPCGVCAKYFMPTQETVWLTFEDDDADDFCDAGVCQDCFHVGADDFFEVGAPH